VVLQLLAIADGDEHVAGEQGVPGLFGDDAHRQTILGIGSRVAVLDEDILVLQVALDPAQQGGKIIIHKGPVVLSPPDPLRGGILANHELVFGGAGAVFAGSHHHRSPAGQLTLAPQDDLLVKAGGGQVPVDSLQPVEAQVIQPEIAF